MPVSNRSSLFSFSLYSPNYGRLRPGSGRKPNVYSGIVGDRHSERWFALYLLFQDKRIPLQAWLIDFKGVCRLYNRTNHRLKNYQFVDYFR